jgi:hypothetical protein
MIVSMHAQVDAAMLAVPDHDVKRMTVCHGESLDAMGIPRRDGAPSLFSQRVTDVCDQPTASSHRNRRTGIFLT